MHTKNRKRHFDIIWGGYLCQNVCKTVKISLKLFRGGFGISFVRCLQQKGVRDYEYR